MILPTIILSGVLCLNLFQLTNCFNLLEGKRLLMMKIGSRFVAGNNLHAPVTDFASDSEFYLHRGKYWLG